jgi:PAS domain S-box-containing protein
MKGYWKKIRSWKWLAIFLLTLSLFNASFQPRSVRAANLPTQDVSASGELQELATGDKIIVGGDSAYPPYQYLENGEPKGFDIDILRAIADIMGMDLEFRLSNWSDARVSLLEGKVDMLAGMAYSTERNRFYDFSTPFATLTFDLFTPNDSDLQDLGDLAGNAIIVQDGGLMQEFLEEGNYGADIVRVPDVNSALEMLASGKSDGALLNKAQGMFFIRQYNYRNIQAMGLKLESVPYSFAVTKGNLPLLTRLNQGLLLLDNNGGYNQIYDKWFALDERDTFWEITKRYSLVLGLIVLSLLLAIFWSWALRRQVKKRTRELAASEEKYRNLIENSDEGVMVVQDGKAVFANHRAEEILGYSLEDIQKIPFHTVIHKVDDERGGQDVQIQGRADRGNHRYLYRVTRSDGQIRWSELSPVQTHWDGNHADLLIFSDVTDHLQAVGALRESEDKFSIAFRTSPDALAITTVSDGRFIEVNESFETLTGYSSEEMRNRTVNELNIWVHPEDRLWLIDQLHLHGKVNEMEVLLRKHGGDLRTGMISARLIEIHGEPCVLTISRDITEKKLGEERFRQQMRRLATLRVVDMTIAASMDLDQVLYVLLGKIVSELKVDACLLLLLDSNLQLVYRASVGMEVESLKTIKINLGEKHAGWSALHWKPVYVLQSEDEPDDLLSRDEMVEAGFIAYYCTPLIAKGRVLGVIELLNRKPMPSDPEWINFFEALADQTAIAIDNAALMETVEKTNHELMAAYDATIKGWARALELRDGDTEGHSQRVLMMTIIIARAMGFQEEELIHIQRGALLHDIGKMAIPDKILFKAGPLTPQEWEIMRQHPLYAYELLSSIPFLRPALDIPYCHHERWNGTGYPRGLAGEDIPLSARIFAVVDVWDALLSNRPYRLAWDEDRTREYIRQNAGILFDPDVIDIFFKQFDELDSQGKFRKEGSTPQPIG